LWWIYCNTFCKIFAAQCYSVSVCPPVCPSCSCILTKGVNISLKFYHCQVATPFYFFVPNVMAIFHRGPPRLHVGLAKITILNQCLASSCAVNGLVVKCYTHSCARPWHVRLLFAEDDDEVFMTRSLNVMPKTTEQHEIACASVSPKPQ